MKKLFMLLFSLAVLQAQAQEEIDSTQVGGIPIEKVEEYKEQAVQMVMFMQYTFNVLGDPTSSVADKETIIRESYSKFFKDDKVQIEDDLVEKRSTITSKDVQAYLKDIEFFFKQAEFNFEIEDTAHFLNDRNQLYFRISTNRNLKAITLKNDTINDNQTRYIEINLDEEKQELKIVSIYTTKLNEDEELRNWWAMLPQTWKDVFLNSLQITGTPTLEQIKQINEIEKLDISNKSDIVSLDPISKFSNLKILKAANTGISDVMPIRNLNKLEILDLSGTKVSTLAPLKYATEIKDLYLSNTPMQNLGAISGMTKIEILYLNEIAVADFSALKVLTNLKDLRIAKTNFTDFSIFSALTKVENLYLSETKISSLAGIEKMKVLKRLYIDRTDVSDLAQLAYLPELQYLNADYTKVTSLEPLTKLPKIEKIYVDNSQVAKNEADVFARKKANCKVIYQSNELLKWWAEMDSYWKIIFRRYSKVSEKATKEELHELIAIEEIDLKADKKIKNLLPLVHISGLKKLNVSQTAITDIAPLAKLFDFVELNISETQVYNLDALKQLTNLEKINISKTKVKSLDALTNLEKITWINLDETEVFDLSPLNRSKNIQVVYADQTNVKKNEIANFKIKHPTALVIFQTKRLKEWWFNLSAAWKSIFETRMKWSEDPTREQLQQLFDIEELTIDKNLYINSLSPIQEFFKLKKLHISDTQINNLIPISNLQALEILEFPQNPIKSLMPLQNLKNLEIIDAQNTLVTDLQYLAKMKKLRVLKISGCPIKKLNGLENTKLEELEMFSTDIRNIKPIHGIKTLRVLKCYSTKLNQRKIDAFKATNRACNVVFY